MRVLTVRQPWAWAVIHGGKNVENRSRNLAGSYRGPVLIHAAQADADNAPDSLWISHADHYRSTHPRRDPDDIHSERGVIIGVVDLVDVHHADDCGDGDWHFCSPWAMPDHHHLVLANPRVLPRPIPAKGFLNLWHPSETLAAQILEQLGEVAS